LEYGDLKFVVSCSTKPRGVDTHEFSAGNPEPSGGTSRECPLMLLTRWHHWCS